MPLLFSALNGSPLVVSKLLVVEGVQFSTRRCAKMLVMLVLLLFDKSLKHEGGVECQTKDYRDSYTKDNHSDYAHIW